MSNITTFEEIEEYVQGDLAYLDLSTKEVEKYIKYIKKLKRFASINHYTDINVISTFEERFNALYEFYKIRFNDEEALALTKGGVLYTDRKKWINKFYLMRILNYEQRFITCSTRSVNAQEIHARKMYCLKNNIDASQYEITRKSVKQFEDKYNLNQSDLDMEYPITDEIVCIWKYIGNMSNEEFDKHFKIDKETFSSLYPTTKDELATLQFLAKLDDDKVKNIYGISKEEIYKKYPLNVDTLNTLKTINKMRNESINNLFGLDKEDILKLRTINKKIVLDAREDNYPDEIKNMQKIKRTTM